jgi:hypothetical protein
MPVRRFRDVSEMEDTLWHERGPELFGAIRRVWDFAARTVPLRFPPGVHRHRSIEEADAQRERWAQANFDAFHARRRKRAELQQRSRELTDGSVRGLTVDEARRVVASDPADDDH